MTQIEQETRHEHPNYWLLAALIAFPSILRWLGQPWNLTPVGGIALFAGAHFARSRWAYATPLAAMVLSDLTLGYLHGDYQLYTFHSLIPFVYGSYVLYVWLGRYSQRTWAATEKQETDSTPWQQFVKRAMPLGCATVAGSASFFLITNFGSWLMYETFPHTPSGLLQCYIAGLPFLRPTLAGDAFYTTVLFSGYAIIQAAAKLQFAPTPNH